MALEDPNATRLIRRKRRSRKISAWEIGIYFLCTVFGFHYFVADPCSQSDPINMANFLLSTDEAVNACLSSEISRGLAPQSQVAENSRRTTSNPNLDKQIKDEIQKYLHKAPKNMRRLF